MSLPFIPIISFGTVKKEKPKKKKLSPMQSGTLET